MAGGFGISIDNGTWTWRRCETFLWTRVMVRMGMIAIPDASLINIHSGQDCPLSVVPVHATHDRTGPHFIWYGGG